VHESLTVCSNKIFEESALPLSAPLAELSTHMQGHNDSSVENSNTALGEMHCVMSDLADSYFCGGF
jgi:hypothetical protein